eukprot:scaffold14929_cov23-Cyclotella_meneghiniana.AAC.4
MKETEEQVGDAITPNTKALKAQCAATPLKQSWEEALEDEGTIETHPREEVDPKSNEKIAATRANERATNESSSEVDAPTEEVVNIEETNASQELNDGEIEINASQELNDGEIEIQPTETSNQQNDNHDDNVQENPPPIPNASHNYSEGFSGEDASSTASDEQLGLDTA